MFAIYFSALITRALAATVLAWMLHLQPHAPWIATYERTADAIAAASQSREEAATLTSLAWFESAFNPEAKGDHGVSLGLFQIQAATAKADDSELLEPERAAKHAARLVRISGRICGGRPKAEALIWYVSGGNECREGERAAVLARHRAALAASLLRP